jgi:hypothetical protein
MDSITVKTIFSLGIRLTNSLLTIDSLLFDNFYNNKFIYEFNRYIELDFLYLKFNKMDNFVFIYIFKRKYKLYKFVIYPLIEYINSFLKIIK